MAQYTFTGQKAKVFEPLEPGDYKFVVVDFEFGTSQAGNEVLKLTLETDAGKRFFDTLVFTDKAFWKIDTFLTAIGKAPKVGLTFVFDAQFAQSLIGCNGTATLGIRTGNDSKKYNEVKCYRDPLEMSAAVGNKGAAPKEAPAPAPKEEEIPF